MAAGNQLSTARTPTATVTSTALLTSAPLTAQPIVVKTDTRGRFRISLAEYGLPPGPYNVYVKPRRAVPIFIANVNPALGEIDFGAALDGDVNGDGVLDEKDVKAIAGAFGSKTGDRNFDPDADFNGDGIVNFQDLSILLANIKKWDKGLPPGQAKKTPTVTVTGTPTPTPSATPTVTATPTPTPTGTPVAGQVKQRVTQAGGRVDTPGGHVIDIPAGVFAEDVDIEFVPRSELDPGELELKGRTLKLQTGAQGEIVGPFHLKETFELTAKAASSGRSVTQFNAPLRLTLPVDMYTTRGKIVLVYLDVLTNEWIELPGQVYDRDARTVSAETDHFTAFGQIEYFDTDGGNASANTLADRLVDTTKSWVLDRWSQWTVTCSNCGAGSTSETRMIKTLISGTYGNANTATTLFVTVNWTTAPTTGSTYVIGTAMKGDNGTATGGTRPATACPAALLAIQSTCTSSLSDSSKNWVENQWFGRTVTLLTGTGAGQTAYIDGNTATALSVKRRVTGAQDWTTAPAAGTTYIINPAVPGSDVPAYGPKLFAEGFRETTANGAFNPWHRLGTAITNFIAVGSTTAVDGIISMPQDGMLILKNSDNYKGDITIVLPMLKTNSSGNGIGGIVWGYQGPTADASTGAFGGSYPKYFSLGKYNNNSSSSQARYFFDACSGITCNHDTGGNVTTLTNACTWYTQNALDGSQIATGAGCEIPAGSAVGTDNSSWNWLEVSITAHPTLANVFVFEMRRYEDTTNGALPTARKAFPSERIVYTTGANEYSGGKIGVFKPTSGGWDFARPQPVGLFPGSFTTCMEETYPFTRSDCVNTSNSLGKPGIVWDSITVPPTGTVGINKTMQVYSGDPTYHGFAYETFQTPASLGTNYSVQATIKTCAGIKATQACVTGALGAGTTGTVNTGGAGTLTVTGTPWTAGQWVGRAVVITSGAQSGQTGIITASTTNSLTFTAATAPLTGLASAPAGQTFTITSAAGYSSTSSAITGGTATTLTVAGTPWTDQGKWVNKTVYLVNATAGWYAQGTITGSGTNTLTVASGFSSTDDSGNVTATSAAASTNLTASGEAWTANQWAGKTVTILSGSGQGQTRTVSSNTATTLTVSAGWTLGIDSTSTFAICCTARTPDANTAYFIAPAANVRVTDPAGTRVYGLTGPGIGAGATACPEDTSSWQSCSGLVFVPAGTTAQLRLSLDRGVGTANFDEATVSTRPSVIISNIDGTNTPTVAYKRSASTLAMSFTYGELNPERYLYEITTTTGTTALSFLDTNYSNFPGPGPGPVTRTADSLVTLSEGVYNLKVTLTNLASFTGSDIETNSLVIDNTAPTITVTTPSPDPARAVPVSFTVTYADTLGTANTNSGFNFTALPTVTVQQTGASASPATATSCSPAVPTVPTSTHPMWPTSVVCVYSYTPTTNAGYAFDGTATITANVTDVAGNVAPARTTTFTVDTQPPTATVSVSPNPAKAGTITVTVTGSDLRSGVNAAPTAAVTLPSGALATQTGGPTCTIGGTAVPPATFPAAAGASVVCTFTFTVPSGENGNSATAASTFIDRAGNSGAASTTFVVDTTLPTLAILNPLNGVTFNATTVQTISGNGGLMNGTATDDRAGFPMYVTGCVTPRRGSIGTLHLAPPAPGGRPTRS